MILISIPFEGSPLNILSCQEVCHSLGGDPLITQGISYVVMRGSLFTNLSGMESFKYLDTRNVFVELNWVLCHQAHSGSLRAIVCFRRKGPPLTHPRCQDWTTLKKYRWPNKVSPEVNTERSRQLPYSTICRSRYQSVIKISWTKKYSSQI